MYIEQPFQHLYQLTIAQLSGEIIKIINTNNDFSSSLYFDKPYLEYNLFDKEVEKKFNNAHFFIRIAQYGLWSSRDFE